MTLQEFDNADMIPADAKTLNLNSEDAKAAQGNDAALPQNEPEMTVDVEGCPDKLKKQKVLIVHASVGSGHKSAANAIAKAFEIIDEQSAALPDAKDRTYYDIEVLDILDFGRIVFNGDSTASMFTGVGRPIYDLTWRYTFTGRLLWGGGTVWSRIMYPKFVEYVREVQPAAIIATHIVGANVAVSARMLTQQEYPIVCVPTDYEVEGLWPHKYTDLFCVANGYMTETLRARKVPDYRIKITGIPVDPQFRGDYDKDEACRIFGLPKDKKLVLFQAGASLPRPYIHFRKAIDELLPYMHTFHDMHFVIVTGKDREYAETLRGELKDRGLTNATVLGYVNNMAHLMAACDLVVCKSGGLTVTEALCSETPMILLGRAYGQEKANVSMLTATGSALHVTTARELVGLLKKIDVYPEIADAVLTNANIIKKPQAAFDIARATIDLINYEKDPLSPIYHKHFLHFYWGNRPAHIR